MTIHSRRIGAALAFWENHRNRILNGFGKDVLTFFEDFALVQPSSDALAGWTTTLVEAGGGESTVTRQDGSGGQLLITTDANEDDGVELQVINEPFKLASGNQVYFGIRFQADEATQIDILTGLCITDTTLLGGMTDGIYMEKLDGGTGISCTTEKNSTETQTDNCAVFAASTWTIWEWFFDGTSVYFYIDGVLVATHTTNICNDEELTVSFQVLAGSANVRTATIDWVRAIQFGRN